jgi:hypothetical protein
MDPLSIGASVGSLSSACIITLKNLNELVGKFRNAPTVLRALSSETKVISISLSQLGTALVSDKHSLLTPSLLKPDIRNALDVALTGCKVTLSCLETEIHSLAANIATDQKISFSDRAKIVWKEDKFRELLEQLTRQHNAIATLQQGFQMYAVPVHARSASWRISNVQRRKALGDILNLMVSAKNSALFQKVANDTKSLRGLYPESNAAKSFLDSLESTGASETNFSVISEQQFEFDDLVTNSQAYRRVLVAATHALKKNTGGTSGEVGDVNEINSEGAQLGKGSNGTEGANQSRKMSAAPGQARGLKHSPIATSGEDSGLQDSESRQSIINDPQSFAQQIRGYLDHVEGESRNAAKENEQLRERLREQETAASSVIFQLQDATARAGKAETELAIALKVGEEMDRRIKRVLKSLSQCEDTSREKSDLITILQSKANELVEIAEEAEKKLKIAEAEAARSRAMSSEIRQYCGDQVDSFRTKMHEGYKEIETLKSDLETSKAEAATVKEQLEEFRVIQRDLSVLFQKGNHLLQGKREMVIDREK